MAFLIIQFREQNIGQGLASWRRIDEEGCAVDVGEPFMQGLVKKCQTCWRVHYITTQLVASSQILFPVPVQHGTGQILWQRSGSSNQ